MSRRPHERWIWTELIGFDNTRPDLGVSEYIEAAGFTPATICLLIGSPDFILSHDSPAAEVPLPPDFCARDGHERNPHRQRQVWTNYQLRALIAELHVRGVAVYLTVFTRFYGDRFHHEWVSDHREVCMVYRGHGWVSSINCLARLADGGFYEDYFIAKLVETMVYYGFDGWHGADGYGPLSGPLWCVDMSDDMVAQFSEATGLALPEEVGGECGHDVDRLEARAAWLWRHVRHEWIDFYSNRWATFWRKAVAALHGAGKQAVVNSAWGRAPFESLYRYGIDYRKIAATGVDGIVVETAAAGLAMDPRPMAAHESRHYDFLAMLMLIRAYVPDTRLIFLHNAHDVVEQWDAIRHMPTLLEREIYSLANVWHHSAEGLRPGADGFLVCLGDGLDPDHWRWLRERWALAFAPAPAATLGATLLWSDAAMAAQVADFTATRTWNSHRLLFQLMTLGAVVQSTVRVDQLHAARGPLLVLNPHLLPADELAAVMAYDAAPVVTIGREPGSLPAADLQFSDPLPPDEVQCRVYGASGLRAPDIAALEEPELIPDDLLAVEDESGYWYHMYARRVSPAFLAACVQVINELSGAPVVTDGADAVTLMAVQQAPGVLRLAVKSKIAVYAGPTVDVRHPIRSVSVLTSFPSLRIQPEGTAFRVRVPGKGVTVLDVEVDGEGLPQVGTSQPEGTVHGP